MRDNLDWQIEASHSFDRFWPVDIISKFVLKSSLSVVMWITSMDFI